MEAGVQNRLSAAFGQVAKGRGVIAAYLYGSHVRGDAGAGSDIDVAVLLEDAESHSSLDLLRLGRELEAQSGMKNIDVRLLNDAPLAARGRILTEGKLLYSGNDSKRVDFEVTCRSRYFDFLPHLEYLRKAFIRRTAERGL
jgi:predicted nucleotidyltransferase